MLPWSLVVAQHKMKIISADFSYIFHLSFLSFFFAITSSCENPPLTKFPSDTIPPLLIFFTTQSLMPKKNVVTSTKLVLTLILPQIHSFRLFFVSLCMVLLFL